MLLLYWRSIVQRVYPGEYRYCYHTLSGEREVFRTIGPVPSSLFVRPRDTGNPLTHDLPAHTIPPRRYSPRRADR